MAVTSATRKATVYSGSEKTEAPLALVGGKLEAKGNFKIAAGTKVLVETSVKASRRFRSGSR